MQYRIGDRDPVTGLYDVIWPDGSFTRNGIKIFNSAHEFGDVVLATQRSDGMMILDGVKATLTEVVTNSFGLGGFGEKPVGYLNGQVFNNEEEVILPTVSVKFAPGSPEELAPDAGNFVVRIKIDRPQRRDLRVKLEFTGTAIAADYTTVGLAADSPTVPIAIITAGSNFADITVTPASGVTGTKTIIITALELRDYRIGQDNTVTANITAIGPTVTVSQLCSAPLNWGAPGVDVSYNLFRLERSNSSLVERIVLNVGFSAPTFFFYGFLYDTSGNFLNIVDIGSFSIHELVIPSGELTSEIAVLYVKNESLSNGWTDLGYVPAAVYCVIGDNPSLVEQYQIINNFSATIQNQSYSER